jgi:hypothetical protein
MTSKTETILQALATLVGEAVNAKFERNASVPEKIPADGLVILRDGNPGLPDEALGGFGNAYYKHEVEIEIYVADGAQNSRDALFDTIITQIGAALETDPDLGGLIFGMSYARPDVTVEIVPGSHAIKSGVLTLILDYETPTALS